MEEPTAAAAASLPWMAAGAGLVAVAAGGAGVT